MKSKEDVLVSLIKKRKDKKLFKSNDLINDYKKTL